MLLRAFLLCMFRLCFRPVSRLACCNCREGVQCTSGVSDVRRVADLLLRNISILKVCHFCDDIVIWPATIFFVLSSSDLSLSIPVASAKIGCVYITLMAITACMLAKFVKHAFLPSSMTDLSRHL